MDGIRKKVSKKTSGFIKKAQQAPAPQVQPALPKMVDPGAPGVPGGAPPPPKAPGGAPMPPPPPKPAEEVEKKEERALTKLTEQFTQLEEKVDTIADTLVELKDSLIGDGKKDKYKELQDRSETVKKPTSEEFGLDKDSLVGTEDEMPKSAEDLRVARKRRIAEELEFHEHNPPNKKYKQQVPAPQVTKLKDAPEDWGQYRLASLALDLSASQKEWSLVNTDTGEVYYKLSACETSPENFATEDFAQEIIKDMKEIGVEAAMQKHGAFPFEKDEDMPVDMPGRDKKPLDLKKDKKPFGDKVDKKPFGDKLDKKPMKPSMKPPMKPLMKKVEVPGEEDELEKESASDDPVEQVFAAEQIVTATQEITASDYHRRFLRAFRLALSAQQKNLVSNPLKASFYDVLADLGIENPQMIIESAFARASDDHFEVTLSKTEEYLDMSDEALIETEAMVGGIDVVVPQQREASFVESENPRIEALKLRARQSSLALSTATDTDPTDRFSELANALPRPKLAGVSKFKV